MLGAKGDALDDTNIKRDRKTVSVMTGRRKTGYFVREVAAQIASGKWK
jgi:hypothetical protein